MNLKLKLSKISNLSMAKFRETMIKKDHRLVAPFFHPQEKNLYGIQADDENGRLHIFTTTVEEYRYDTITPFNPAAHLFEREILELHQISPDGHPWAKPVRFTKELIGNTNFYRIEGEESHEVAVGPVHAGVIEPGHFRFQCHGEIVHHLEISLGYQYRGIEKRLIGGPFARTPHYMEVIAGDTSVGHMWAYCKNIESLANIQVSKRSNLLRALMLELERLANHTGDLGALAGDVGFLPTLSYCGRLRGDYLNLTALICGSRFGRGMLTPGGERFDLTNEQLNEFERRLDSTFKDTKGAIKLLWHSNMVLNRFEKTGTIPFSDAKELGLVGVAARASGINIDVRKNFDQTNLYSDLSIATYQTGDVHARARVRLFEIENSYFFIKKIINKLKDVDVTPQTSQSKPDANSLTVSLIEGWRGEICHIAITDADGKFSTYKIIDPSFHNWAALAMCLRNQEISDFPLCNKSFNLSYCGHDL